jgi:2-polyprenyl-6-methoxyphenol hydroxylase-like FAD-dependent oxidoreductase
VRVDASWSETTHYRAPLCSAPGNPGHCPAAGCAGNSKERRRRRSISGNWRAHKENRAFGAGLKQIAQADLGELDCAYNFQCSLPQWRTEAILRDKLKTFDIPIEYGSEVTAIEDDAGMLRVDLVRDGQAESFHASYVLGAGGGRSVTRHSMQEHLGGETYSGKYIVADVRLALPTAPERGRVIVSASGFVLMSPLPDQRWLIFVNREDDDDNEEAPSAEALGALVDKRAGVAVGLSDMHWVSYFRMHRRAVGALGDGRRFLLGDAGHLSSPLGGEGINKAFMDASNIAWKLALVVRGHAKPSLLESYVFERGLADHHAMDVSDEIHNFVMGLVAMCANGGTPLLPEADPDAAMAVARRRAMLDVSYAGSAVVCGADGGSPAPGDRFPGRCRLEGTSHHLIHFGDPTGLDHFRSRWGELIQVVDGAAGRFVPAECGVDRIGMTLVRPDGHIGFRASTVDDASVAALESHLASYLVTPGRPI